ncbi:site-specific recombinase [Pasteurella canis]|uniref:Recombinase n=1 Tax=Pasteurella canis TaxID=753 RepID=A0ABQ4VP35_9PAST|nr:recombinase [Pasteurella canis]MXN88848.1 recombinase [Pasteurella canis]UDW83441.1 recombinase [Pasteurella canis]UEC22956.1 recombinase [Pasteurella canis]GJH43402.1 recombinase [Pasteurella canis]GJJ81162.1 recombinase [Pasteurella canis]
MIEKYKLNQENIIPFLTTHIEQQNTFTVLNGLCQWLRLGGKKEAPQRLSYLIQILQNDVALAGKIASLLCQWICQMRLYPLFISCGLLGREGFGREIQKRLYERFNPSFKDLNDLRDIFFVLFCEESDEEWLQATAIQDWIKLLDILQQQSTEKERENVHNHLRYEGFFAIEMLAIWIAAEELEPELMRLDPTLLDADSPFVALHREVANWVASHRQNRQYDDAHLQVMFDQCREQIDRIHRRGASAGSTLGVAHLLTRLDQTLTRLATLMDIFQQDRLLPHRILVFTGELAIASARSHSAVDLWKQSVKMLARSITQNKSDHGEHYITRDRKEYRNMFFSAAGGGILIAFMALFKLYLGDLIEDRVWRGIAEGLNYGIGFTIIFMLHGTVATKQPAMTAARFAETVDNGQGKSVNLQLAQLLIDVFRSQTVAVLGNVTLAILVACLLAIGYQYYAGMPLLTEAEIAYQQKSIDPMKGSLWFAAIAGFWLFFSGIISGYFDNRSNYLNLKMRLRNHPILRRILTRNMRYKFAEYWHDNYGSIMGNLCFGLLLGLTGLVGYLLNLPLDIRHVAFSSANLGYMAISGDFTWQLFLQGLMLVLLIGIVNLVVSFFIALCVALRSLDAQIESWCDIGKCVWKLIKQRPLSLFFPY